MHTAMTEDRAVLKRSGFRERESSSRIWKFVGPILRTSWVLGGGNFRIWEVFEHYHPQMIMENNIKCDIMLPIEGNHGSDTIEKMNGTQAARKNFEDWTLAMISTFDDCKAVAGVGVTANIIGPRFVDNSKV